MMTHFLLPLLLSSINSSCWCSAFSPSPYLISRKSCSTLQESYYYQEEAQRPQSTFTLDPTSERAKDIIQNHLGLTQNQHNQLTQLAKLVVTWNQKINLVSRKDCTTEVIFGRHILPSLALLSPLLNKKSDDGSIVSKVVDVGTGGGFPGLPLAIACPKIDFLLVDSVGKKLKAVDEIVTSLSLKNIETLHERAEYIVDDIQGKKKHMNAYDVCVGRSVATIPKFCFWTQDLLRSKDGRLMYIVGGDIDDDILSRTESTFTINELLQQEEEISDKRILVFPQSQVQTIAATSGEKKSKRNPANSKKIKRNKSKLSKGGWTKRDNSAPKQRGYENFQRYES